MPEAEAIDLLSEVDLPYGRSRVVDDLFLRSTLSLLKTHFKTFPWLGKIYGDSSSHLDSFGERKDLCSLPFLHFIALDNLAGAGGLSGSAALEGNSNDETGAGTRGTPASKKSAARLEKMVFNSLKQLKVGRGKIVNQLYIQGGEPKSGNDSADKKFRGLFAADSAGEEVQIDLAGFDSPTSLHTAKEFEAKFDRLAAEGLPVTVFCNGAVGFKSMELITALERKFSLPVGSRLFTRGMHVLGDNSSKIASFFLKAEQQLRIPRAMIRDYYLIPGLHYPLVQCAYHRYHIPGFLEVIVRDLMTLAPVLEHAAGVIQFISAFDEGSPNNSILTNEFGYIYEEACSCGIESKILQFKSGMRESAPGRGATWTKGSGSGVAS
jgi:hypothetical protein